MNHLKTYKLFESLNLIKSFVTDYLEDCKWDIKNSLGNCAFFAKDFYDWCQSKKIQCRLIYLKQDEKFSKSGDIEDHIVVAIDDYIIDFVYTNKGVSKKTRENNFLEALKRQMSPEITAIYEFKEKYQKWGYNDIEEISYSEAYEGHMARCQTIDYPKRLNESIKVPIKVGDTVLGGRFKNKKIVVKKIGKNKKGDITINDKPLLKFRIIKESLQEDIDYYFRHLEDDNFIIQTGDDYFRIFKPINGTMYSYLNCNPFQWSEIAGEISRYVSDLDEKSVDYAYIVHSVNGVTDRTPLGNMILDDTFDCGEILSFTIGFK